MFIDKKVQFKKMEWNIEIEHIWVNKISALNNP